MATYLCQKTRESSIEAIQRTIAQSKFSLGAAAVVLSRNWHLLSGPGRYHHRSCAAKQDHCERGDPTEPKDKGGRKAEEIEQRIDQEQPPGGARKGHREEFACRILQESGGHQEGSTGAQHEAAEDRGQPPGRFDALQRALNHVSFGACVEGVLNACVEVCPANSSRVIDCVIVCL